MVFVIVYALFIFVDLAVATASNVRPSQPPVPSRWRVRAPGWTTAFAPGPCPAHLVLCSPTAALWLLPHLCPASSANRCGVCLSPLASPLPPLRTHPRASGLDAWLTARSGTPLSVP